MRLDRNMKNSLVFVVLVGASMATLSTANGQTTSPQSSDPHVISSQDLNLPRMDIRSHKKQLVAANLDLTDSEATKFLAGI